MSRSGYRTDHALFPPGCKHVWLDPFARDEVSLRGARVQARDPRDLITAPEIVLKFLILLLRRVNTEL